jgi:hypothetical protein
MNESFRMIYLANRDLSMMVLWLPSVVNVSDGLLRSMLVLKERTVQIFAVANQLSFVLIRVYLSHCLQVELSMMTKL